MKTFLIVAVLALLAGCSNTPLFTARAELAIGPFFSASGGGMHRIHQGSQQYQQVQRPVVTHQSSAPFRELNRHEMQDFMSRGGRCNMQGERPAMADGRVICVR